MTTIRQEDLIQSVADAFQFISYFHPLDFVQAVTAAYEREQSPAQGVCRRRASGREVFKRVVHLLILDLVEYTGQLLYWRLQNAGDDRSAPSHHVHHQSRW